jgi:hypothetical protein
MANSKPLKKAPQTDLVWGAPAIAAVTGLSVGQVYYHHGQGRFGDAVFKFSPRKLVGIRKQLLELKPVPVIAAAE